MITTVGTTITIRDMANAIQEIQPHFVVIYSGFSGIVSLKGVMLYTTSGFNAPDRIEVFISGYLQGLNSGALYIKQGK